MSADAETSAGEGRPPVVLQVLPALETGGVERGTVDIAEAIVNAGGRSLVASQGGRMVHELVRVGATHFELPLGAKNPVVMMRNIGRLRTLIREEGVDIVHARSRAPAWSAFFACRKTDAAFLTTFHGTYNRAAPFAFHDADHGPRDGTPLRAWVDAQLRDASIDITGGRVQLLCLPRMLGYVFNPLSLYFCHDAAVATGLVQQITGFLDISGTARERDSDIVSLHFSGCFDIGTILVRDRLRRKPPALAIDALVIRQDSANHDSRIDFRTFDLLDPEHHGTIIE